MSRQIPSDRFAALVEAGTATFVAHGYRRTQMQDVADAMGVAKGTVYAAVASKDALLLACLRYADGFEPAPASDSWPLPHPGAGDFAALVSERLSEVAELAIHHLTPAADGSATASAAAELELVVTDLMRRLGRHQRAIKVVDRCAPEIPELAELWFGEGRADLVNRLRDHLAARAEQGLVRLTADPTRFPGRWDVVARTIVETCVLWAVHLHWDPAPAAFRTTRPDDEIAAVLAALFSTGLVPDGSPTRPAPLRPPRL
ncbi:TetR/AcrR family transcriptional regulator [Nocardioides speluncae]|uniref:TetR/AcrR family transcriptional regulator n=1 Tax=Nocardioides speluncae TaxID=2670337 RepID=UPI00197FFEE5|nr:TetR/AcrR family transcriptional regulator [Nocardioides speluncae]